jgi:hypothetical protein
MTLDRRIASTLSRYVEVSPEALTRWQQKRDPDRR